MNIPALIEKYLLTWPTLAKVGRFLHLVEDDLTHVSMSGIQLWATTYTNIHMIFLSHDWHAQVAAAGSNAVAAGMHAVKRGQVLKNTANAQDDDPTADDYQPWLGEEKD